MVQQQLIKEPLQLPPRKKKLRRQRKLSLHQLRKRRHIGSGEPRVSSTTNSIASTKLWCAHKQLVRLQPSWLHDVTPVSGPGQGRVRWWPAAPAAACGSRSAGQQLLPAAWPQCPAC
eukprot:1142957-Pelagomonas_calceolata.AAC.10